MGERLVVFNPEGFPPKVTAVGMAPRPEQLEGARLFLVDTGFDNSDNFMVQLKGWLEDHRPGIRTEIAHWRDESQPDPELCRRLQKEADAVVIGVGT